MPRVRTANEKKQSSETDELAALCFEQRMALTQAGRRMHDEIGPLVAAAGLKLQLLKMDLPEAAESLAEATALLDEAFEYLREVSQRLLGSPAQRGGLRLALSRLADRTPEVILEDRSTAELLPEVASAIFDVVAAAVEAAQAGGARIIRIRVSGKAGVTLRIADDGRWAGRVRKLAVPKKLAKIARVSVELSTEGDKIVLIRYALRRPPRG